MEMQNFIINQISTEADRRGLVYLETHRYPNIGTGFLKSPDGKKTHRVFEFRFDDNTVKINNKGESMSRETIFDYGNDDDMSRMMRKVFEGCPEAMKAA